MRTDFLIAGIQITIEAAFDIRDNKGFSLYRLSMQENGSSISALPDTEKADELLEKNQYVIRLTEETHFPSIDGKFLYQDEMNLYIERDGTTLHFFRIPLTRWAAAWCETVGERLLVIHYREEAKSYFRNTAGCFNAAAFENILYINKMFLFHCSYVDIGGEAVLFSAHSGGGKTTHGLLWEKNGMGEMINGDRAVIECIGDNCYMVHGLPIAGSSNVFKNRSLPLKAIYMIEKAPVNEVIQMAPSKRFAQVFEQVTIHTWDKDFVNAAVDFVGWLVENVPVRLLRCLPDEGAVAAVKESLAI